MKRKTFYIIILFALGVAFGAILLVMQQNNRLNPIKLEDKLWSLKLNQLIISTPMLGQNNIIVRTTDELYSLRINDGYVIWNIDSRAYAPLVDAYAVSRPIINNTDFLAVAEESNSVKVYSTTSGNVYWEIPSQRGFIYELVLVANTLLMATHDNSLHAYEVSSGRSLWEIKVPPRSYLAVAANSTNVVLSARNQIQVFDLQTGKLLREKAYGEATGKVILNDPDLFLCYIEDKEWHVASIELNTLDTNWVFNAGNIAGCYLSIGNDQVLIYSNILISLDKSDGIFLWKNDAQDFYSAPAVYSNNIYYISITGSFRENICVLDARTGESNKCDFIRNVNWLFGLPTQIPSPIVVNNILIIPEGSEINAYLLDPSMSIIP